jgi:prepilin-type N-terminal cleavage/methylation domain-containing protein
MRRSRAGFTLIELMVVVAILGVLAAIAIPSFSIYMKRSHAAESTQELRALFNRAATYYQRERADPGIIGEHRIDCTVGNANNNVTPNESKQQGEYTTPEWLALGYDTFYGYYRYEVISGSTTSKCGIPANTLTVYTLRAIGDLDADGTKSTFDLAVGSNGDNELYHARGFHMVNDYE